jgi:hypothetical protein
VDDIAALDELNRLLDADDAETVNTSMRLSVSLRDAAAIGDHDGGRCAPSEP